MASFEQCPKGSKKRAVSRLDPISIRIAEAVRVTGLSRTKIYQLIADGKIDAAKVGKATLIYVQSLRQFLQDHPRPQHGGDRRSVGFKGQRPGNSSKRSFDR
ncbi:helix-turn-helix domain-containing protein [Sphingopyxis sp. LARHCG72]